MSHATSARTSGKDRLRHRPSATVRDMSVENAPVLFRLPVIAPTAVAPHHDSAHTFGTQQYPTQGSKASQAAGGVSPAASAAAMGTLPYAVSGTGTLPFSRAVSPDSPERITPPLKDASSDGGVTPAIASSDGGVTPASGVTPTSAAGGVSPLRARENSENGLNGENWKKELIEPAIVTAPTIDARFAKASKQSWWEHWSSGVVLILLIIGLVTASILALNDHGKARVEQLAGEPLSASLDEFDLSNVTIPDVEPKLPQLKQPAVNLPENNLPAANLPIVSAATVAPETNVSRAEPLPADANTRAAEAEPFTTNAASASPMEPLVTAPPAESPLSTGSLQLSASTTSSPTRTTTSQPASTVQSDLSAPANSPSDASATKFAQAQLGAPATANLAPSASSEGAASSTAASPHISLDTPLAVTAPPLFSAEHASTANNRNGAPLPLSTELPPLPQAASSGTSPTLYDGAALQSQLQAASSGPESSTTAVSPLGMPQLTLPSSSMPGMVAGTYPMETQFPSYSTLLTSATNATSTAMTPGIAYPAIPGPTAGVTTPTTGSGTTAVNTAQTTTLQSTTPELDTAAIIQAYRHFSEINNASNGIISNRWTSGTATVPSTSGQPTPSTGGMGFTLGSPTSK